jgi:hypothetical protein
MARSSGSTFLENSNIGFPVVVCGKRFSLRRTTRISCMQTGHLSHANRVSSRAFYRAPGNGDFGRQRRRAPISFRTVFVSRRDRERAITPAPNRGKSRVFRGDGEFGVSARLRGGLRRTQTCNQIVMSSYASSELRGHPAAGRSRAWSLSILATHSSGHPIAGIQADGTSQFETGANRDTDRGKRDYEGLLSPLVIEALPTCAAIAFGLHEIRVAAFLRLVARSAAASPGECSTSVSSVEDPH